MLPQPFIPHNSCAIQPEVEFILRIAACYLHIEVEICLKSDRHFLSDTQVPLDYFGVFRAFPLSYHVGRLHEIFISWVLFEFLVGNGLLLNRLFFVPVGYADSDGGGA